MNIIGAPALRRRTLAARRRRPGKLTFSNNAYLKLTTEWIMLHDELTNPNDS